MQSLVTGNPEVEYERALGDGPRRELRRFSATALVQSADAEAQFYALAACEPVIVTDADNLPSLAGVTIDALPELLGSTTLEGYSRASGEREPFGAAAFVRELRSGHARHNVVDHPLSATPCFGRMRAPCFFRTSWLGEHPSEPPVLSLTLSAKGNLTALHVDAYGIQGWLQLLEGKKRWKLVAPEFTRPRMDPATAEVSLAPGSAWDGVERWEAELGAGQLIFVPPGWAHLVWTTEASLGIGGSMINAFCIEETMRSWLSERALGFSEELDLVKLVNDRAPKDHPGASAALAEYATWRASGA